MKRIAFLAVLAALAACGSGELRPRELLAGADACEYCHMAVADPNRAAQWVSERGSPLTFDEPGCLAAWIARNPDARGKGFVADENGSGWIPVEQATYVRGASRTDMGFNVIAFRDSVVARRRANEGRGTLLSWAELTREEKGEHAH